MYVKVNRSLVGFKQQHLGLIRSEKNSFRRWEIAAMSVSPLDRNEMMAIV